MHQPEQTQVVIIGAGPSGAIAAALLARRGVDVVVVEKEQFPRFSVGESLLPQCMDFLAEAGLLEQVCAVGFQYKNGASFQRGEETTAFDFAEKHTDGFESTFQVERAKFDQILIEGAEAAGAKVHFSTQVIQAEFNPYNARLTVCPKNGKHHQIECQFVLDASGFGRVLPRLLGLYKPSNFPVRTALFTHINDGITLPDYDRNKILIHIHPHRDDIWYWLIPFANGRCSTGVIARPQDLDLSDTCATLRAKIGEAPAFADLLANATFDTPVRSHTGYSYNVTQLYGERFALLGNAGEFLDPVFSSGLAIAMKSASLAAELVARSLQNEPVDWEREFAQELQQGVDTFRAYVEAWYDGRFQEVVFFAQARAQPAIRNMISSILAGYVWDQSNPFVADPQRRLNALVALCQG